MASITFNDKVTVIATDWLNDVDGLVQDFFGASGSSTIASASNSAGPALLNEAATSTNPTICPNKADLDSGIGWINADDLVLIAGGTVRLQWGTGTGGVAVTGNLFASNAAGAIFPDEAASSTNPTLVPDRGDLDTGVGSAGTDILSLIAGSIEGLRITESGGSISSYTIANAAQWRADAGSDNATNLITGSIPLARIPTVLTAKDADLWDGGDKTISTSNPSGGSDGDVWFKYVA